MTMISVKVLSELQPRPFKYVVDEKNQTIQGFHIEDTDIFWAVESAVHSSEIGRASCRERV